MNTARGVVDFPCTREAALGRLEEFLESGLGGYAARRNHVEDGHGNVSRLSGALRHRLVGEWEVVGAVMRRGGWPRAEKFLQEVVWRTYWKGWLEQRPGVWEDWKRLRGEECGRCGEVAGGRSGCAVMDRFARELVETGYLHNHARMWWASFWVHRLRLPWAVGRSGCCCTGRI
jgi:deoxyribodipyrimidine photo-lyase